LDLPVFFFASLSVIIFYLAAQCAQRPWGWLKSLPYLPLLLALGIGMSINNGIAVLEALFDHQSDFVRTPKQGSTHAIGIRPKNRYKAARSVSFWIEVALALYFTYLLGLSIWKCQWASIPFLAMFQFGFVYVVIGSMEKWFDFGAMSGPPEEPSDPVLA
jgi:hypothetical protein